jgi:signal peptidase I
MEPTYRNGRFNFCWRLSYLFSDPERYDVVVVRLAGEKVVLLKRIVALGGESVSFRRGKLIVNGEELEEPYISYSYNWNLEPRQVEKEAVYVVGDNRQVPMKAHYFGQTSVKRIVGTPLW